MADVGARCGEFSLGTGDRSDPLTCRYVPAGGRFCLVTGAPRGARGAFFRALQGSCPFESTTGPTARGEGLQGPPGGWSQPIRPLRVAMGCVGASRWGGSTGTATRQTTASRRGLARFRAIPGGSKREFDAHVHGGSLPAHGRSRAPGPGPERGAWAPPWAPAAIWSRHDRNRCSGGQKWPDPTALATAS